MTEKRFKEIYPDIIRSNYCFTDNGEPIGDKEVVELLNHLHEENMQLKGEVAHYKLILMGLEEQAREISKIYSAPVGHCRCTTEPHRCDEND